jgi:hypothetical protein
MRYGSFSTPITIEIRPAFCPMIPDPVALLPFMMKSLKRRNLWNVPMVLESEKYFRRLPLISTLSYGHAQW